MKHNLKNITLKKDVLEFLTLYSDKLSMTKYNNETHYSYSILDHSRGLEIQYFVVENRGFWKTFFQVGGKDKLAFPSKRRISFDTFKSKFFLYFPQ